MRERGRKGRDEKEDTRKRKGGLEREGGDEEEEE
jgi:hypothetical protein